MGWDKDSSPIKWPNQTLTVVRLNCACKRTEYVPTQEDMVRSGGIVKADKQTESNGSLGTLLNFFLRSDSWMLLKHPA